MSGHRHYGLGMASFLPKSHIKTDSVAAGPTLMEEDDRVCRLDICPLEIAIHIRADATEKNLSPRSL